MKNIIGQKLTDFKDLFSFTSKQLAIKINASEEEIEFWESGLSEPPLYKLEEISRILNIDVASFFEPDIIPPHQLKTPLKINLEYYRRLRNYEISYVAQKLNIGESTYEYFEKHDARRIELEELYKLANLYDTTLDELVGRKYSEWISSFSADIFRKLMELPINKRQEVSKYIDELHKQATKYKRNNYNKIKNT